MPITYERASQETTDVLTDVMKRYHGALHDAGVTVDILLAYGPRNVNGDTTRPAIKDGQYACLAKVRITNLRERALGHADVELQLDGDKYDEWSPGELDAILDHELSHLEPTLDRDDLDRPLLRTVKHDHQFGWFDDVARRHGTAAFEVQQATKLLCDTDKAQLYLPGFEIAPARKRARA